MTDKKDNKPTSISAFLYPSLFIALVITIFVARADKIVPLYRGTATLKVSLDHFVNKTPKGVTVTKEVLDYQVDTLIEGLVSQEVMSEVIRDNDLINNSDFVGQHAGEAYLESLSRKLAQATRIRQRRRGAFFDVSVRDSNPSLAKDLCKWVAKGVVDEASSTAIKPAETKLGFLFGERDAARLRLRESEEAMLEFRMGNRLIISPAERESLLLEDLRAAQRKLVELNGASTQIGKDLKMIESLDGELTRETLSYLSTLSADRGVQKAYQEIIELEVQVENAQFQLGEQHPDVKRQKEGLRFRIDGFNRLLKKTVPVHEGRVAHLQAEIRATTNIVSGLENELLQLARLRPEYDRLKREIDLATSEYHSVIKAIEENESHVTYRESPLSVVDDAGYAVKISPSQSESYWRAGAEGLAVGVLIVLMLNGWALFFGRPKFAR